jgi:DNA-binding NtrC family response regulator
MSRVRPLEVPARLGAATALVVSPFVSDHLALRTLFSRRGWVLHSAFTFQEALHLLREEAIPVVICHRHLLDGDWRSLAAWSRQLPHPLKVIVASKTADPTLITAAEEAGAFGALFTPFDLQTAERIVLRAWTSSQDERAVSRVRGKPPSRAGSGTENTRAKHAGS